MGETDAIAEYIVSTTFDDLPDEVIDHAKLAIRDYLGVAIYGSHHEVGEHIVKYVDGQSAGTESTVIGHGSSSATGAALANGTFGHAIDYDDTFESIVIHPTSPVFGAGLAAAERAGASGRDLLTGYAVGCETAFRIGHSTYPEHYMNGWHATGTIGSFGAAAAAASILGLDENETKHAIGIVGSGSSALKKNFGSMTKPLHAGHAAEMGLRAAILAVDGFTADEAILEGPNGYGEAMTFDDGYDPDVIVDGDGRWAVTDIGFKPYPSGVITHAAMDVLRSIVIDHDLEPDDVERITVTLDDAATDMLFHENPANALQAKFSIEFCLAAILLERRAGIHEFTDEYVERRAVKEAISKVERAFEPNLFDVEYAGYGARVVVELRDGEILTDEEKYAPGSPTNPVDEERLDDKFEECAETVLDDGEIDRLVRSITSLEAEGSIDAITSILQIET